MESDRTKWNAKFGARDGALRAPESFLVERMARQPRGRILDVACGDGRHALALAELGFETTGVDLSDVGLARLRRSADHRGVSVALHQLDLDRGEGLRELGEFDAIVIGCFKPARALWDVLVQVLRVEGVLILCTFNSAQAAQGFPQRFCLEDRELVAIHPLLDCVEYTRFIDGGRHLDGYLFHKRAVAGEPST